MDLNVDIIDGVIGGYKMCNAELSEEIKGLLATLEGAANLLKEGSEVATINKLLIIRRKLIALNSNDVEQKKAILGCIEKVNKIGSFLRYHQQIYGWYNLMGLRDKICSVFNIDKSEYINHENCTNKTIPETGSEPTDTPDF